MNTRDGIDPMTYRVMFETEDEHWWFRGMESITTRLFDSCVAAGELPPRSQCRALDAGCGTGRNLRLLERFADRVTGVDHSMHALGPCCERGYLGRLVRGSVNLLPFADASFDLVATFDVLMTQGVQDEAALAEFTRVLRPGGWVFVRVPAFDWLRGQHDIAWRVAHRYERREMVDKLTRAGFSVRRASYANTWLFPLAVVKRAAERFFPQPHDPTTDDLRHGAGRSVVGNMLASLVASEGPWIERLPLGLPWGLSLIALARKAPVACAAVALQEAAHG